MIDLKNVILKLGSVGNQVSDSEENKLRHRFLVYMGSLMGVGGLLWGTITFYYELYYSSLIPFGYTFLTLANFTYFRFSKDFATVRFV